MLHPPMECIKVRDHIGSIPPGLGVALPNGKLLDEYIPMPGGMDQIRKATVCLHLCILDPLIYGTKAVLHPGLWSWKPWLNYGVIWRH